MDKSFVFCTECGSRVDSGSGFCPNCGARMSGQKDTAPNIPPVNQPTQNYGVDYQNSMYNQQGNIPQYPPQYNQYEQPQYMPQRKKTNTGLVIAAVILGVLALAVLGYFGFKLLQGNNGAPANGNTSIQTDKNTSTPTSGGTAAPTKENPGNTTTLPDDKSNTADQDITGTWKGTVTFNQAVNLIENSDSEQIRKILNKPLKTMMEIDPESVSTGKITIYMAQDTGEDPGSDGLPLPYKYSGGMLKAEMKESDSIITVDFKIGDKNGTLTFKGTMSISVVQSDDSIGTIKGIVDISRTSKKTSGTGGGAPSNDANGGGQNNNSTGQDSQVSQLIEDPALYLPKPNMKHTYNSWYQDGSSGKTDVVAGVIPDFSLVTTVELIEQSEAYTQHFMDGADGVYVFSDEEFNSSSSLWLPFNAKVGDSWDDEGVSRKILKLGAVCDLGYMRYDNCIVMEIDYSEAGTAYICYIAPGAGTVLMQDRDSGSVRLQLLSTEPISSSEASKIVQQYSPNAMSAVGD